MTLVQLLLLLLLLVLLLLLATVGRKLSELVKYDVAYGCFLFCGLVSLLFMIAAFIPMSDITVAMFGLLVGVPLVIISLVAMVISISLTIFLRHHKPLVILSLLTVIVAFVIATQFGPEILHVLVLILYPVMTIGLSFRWFLILRKRWGKNI